MIKRALQSVKRFALPAGFVLCLAVGGFFLYGLLAEKQVEREAPENSPTALIADLRHFDGANHLRYSFFDKEGREIKSSHTEIAPLAAGAEIPFDPIEISEFDYMKIEVEFFRGNEKEPSELSITYNPKTGKMDIDGMGFGEFETIGIEARGGEAKAKTDWAGGFSLEDIEASQEGADQKDRLKIAFYDHGFINDAADVPKRRVLDVFYAPGGGQVNSDGINEWQPFDCGSGLVPYSFCMVPGTAVNLNFLPDLTGPLEELTGFISAALGPLDPFELIQFGLDFFLDLVLGIFNILWPDIGSQDNNLYLRNFTQNFVTPLMAMTNELTVMMTYHTAIIGSLFDAKQQLETQTELQRLSAEAHKDYHPSELMCQFGTFVRSVSRAEERVDTNKQGLSRMMNVAYRSGAASAAAGGYSRDIEARIRQLKRNYCDPRDLNGGLALMCNPDSNNCFGLGLSPEECPFSSGFDLDAVDYQSFLGGEKEIPPTPERYNKDINFTRTVGLPLTLNVGFMEDYLPNEGCLGIDVGIDCPFGDIQSELDDFLNDFLGLDNRYATPDEQDVLALARNLYWPQALDIPSSTEVPKKYATYMDARQLFAMQNVAHSSFTSIVGMKSRTDPFGLKKPKEDDESDSTDGGSDTLGSSGSDDGDEGEKDNLEVSGWKFMKILIKDFGLNDEEIEEMLGAYPSYYAQMEVLTKKIYQSPNFYTNLIDKPVNIDRISVAMEAIKLMNGRDRFESALRREMLTSMLVEEALTKETQKVQGEIFNEATSGVFPVRTP